MKLKYLIGSIIMWACMYSFAGAYTIHNDSVIEIPLEDYDLKVRAGDPVDHVRNQTRAHGASIGINGWFFCPAEWGYSYCGADNSTSSERIIQGEMIAKRENTAERGILGVTEENKAIFVQNNQHYGYRWNSNQDQLNEIFYGIWNRPILLDKWVDVVQEYTHLIDAKLNTTATKAFICTTQDADTIFLGFVKIQYLYHLPKYLKETYDCYYAIWLDAWRSSALVVDDKYLKWPWRKVTDGYLAVPKPAFIEQKINEYKLSKTEVLAVKRLHDRFIYEAQIRNGQEYLDYIITTIEWFEQSQRLYPLAKQRAILRMLKTNLSQVEEIDTSYGFIHPNN